MSLGLRTSLGVNWTPNLGLESSLAGVLTISSSNQQQSFFGTKQCEAFLQFPESLLGRGVDASSRGNLNHQGVLKDASEGPVQGWRPS